MDMDVGVILLNMGGPNSIDEVRLFMKNMFNDKNILPVNRVVRKVISSIIVNRRIHEAEENYKKIGGKSPLNEITQSLALKLESRLGLPVRLGMRYVPPFVTDAIKEFKEKGVDKIVLFPMYPHHSKTTTLSAIEDVKHKLKMLNYYPKIEIVEPYFDDYKFILIQTRLIVESIAEKNPEEFTLIVSAHGLPMSTILSGDSYEKHINANLSALKIYLREKNLYFKNISLAYQSKVGKDKWLEPSLVDVLLQHKNSRKVLIFPISFTIDNSETVFELSIEHFEVAKKLGYQEYIVSKCPNDRDDFADFIDRKIKSVLE